MLPVSVVDEPVGATNVMGPPPPMDGGLIDRFTLTVTLPLREAGASP